MLKTKKQLKYQMKTPKNQVQNNRAKVKEIRAIAHTTKKHKIKGNKTRVESIRAPKKTPSVDTA